MAVKKYLLFPLLLSLLQIPAAVPGMQMPDDPLTKKVDALFTEINNDQSPGAAVLVVKDGNVLLRRCYGMANLEHKVPICPSTVFDVASVSKQFTGMAISMLVEKGAISLKDDIRKYIPELPDFDHTITVGHLVHHTSGLRDWPGTLALAGWRMDDVITFKQILNMAYHQQDLNFVPGSEYSYSNTGYNLLAELVERVSGESFREWADEHIFGPLGMDNTFFSDDHTEVVPGRAYGYQEDNGRFHAVPDGLTAPGSSSLYTTIDDLAKWVINLDDPDVGGRPVIGRMFRQDTLNNGKRNAYAFGLVAGEYRGLKTMDHSGSWAAFNTFLLNFPQQNFSVVVLMNHAPADPGSAAYAIADLYLATALEDADADHQPVTGSSRGTGPNGSTGNQPGKKRGGAQSLSLPVSLLDAYTGTYRLGPAWYVRIERRDGQLTSHATAETRVPMTARSDSTFWVAAYGAPVTFLRDQQGKVVALRYRGMTCPRVGPVSPREAATFEDFTGEFKSEELGTTYTLTAGDGKLMAWHRRHGTIALIPAWKDEFRGAAWFMHSVKFVRDEEGKVTGFLVSQPRCRNQRFIKQELPE